MKAILVPMKDGCNEHPCELCYFKHSVVECVVPAGYPKCGATGYFVKFESVEYIGKDGHPVNN